MPGFKGWKVTGTEGNTSGSTLLDAPDCFLPHTLLTSLCGSLQDISRIGGIGAVSMGRVEMVSSDLAWWLVTFSSASDPTEGKSAEMHHEALNAACPGDNVDFKGKNVFVQDV